MADLKSHLKLGKVLGSGHFGTVFLGQDQIHGDVAVKVPKQLPGEDPAEWDVRKKELLQEGKYLRQADHRNVVRVHYLVEAEKSGDLHLVMQFCENGSLQLAFEKGPINLGDVLKATTDVTLGLQALHARDMIHRDIKPGNLLIDSRGIAKLGDFGLVTDKILFGYASHTGYSDHLAFELWKGVGTSVRSDIWALGMTIYRLLHGAEWYGRSQRPKSVVRLGGFAGKLKWLPHIPKRWRSVIRKMLEDDTKSRYQNADQVLAALATLSTEPNWKCNVRPDKITWDMERGDRQVHVEWRTPSNGKHSWLAESLPIGEGRKRRLGGSMGEISASTAERELKEFFAR